MTDADVGFVQHEPCPNCGSKDNLARYSDGHAYCFGCSHYEKADGQADNAPRKDCSPRSSAPMLTGEPLDIPARALLKATCEKWRYHCGQDEQGRQVQIANYCDDAGRIVAQKLRYRDKRMSWRGDKKAAGLYGQHLWRDGGRMLVVTEGEIDALSVSQVQQHKWPVVSIADGAQGAARAFRKSIDFLSKWEKVVLMFDNDEHGQRAAEECAALLRPGQAFIALLPLKDANDMLKAKRGDEIVTAIWEAKAFRPDGIVSGASLVSKALQPIETGLPWISPTMTRATYGRRWGEVFTLGAGTGVGKTDLFMQQAAMDLFDLNLNVGMVLLEQQPEDSLRRIIGKRTGVRYHVPDGKWASDDLQQAFDKERAALGRLYLYDHFGAIDWETIEQKLTYLVVGCGCKSLYLDHLTALVAHEDDKNAALGAIMEDIATFALEHRVLFHLISHLNTPEGKPHEEGGRVMIRHFNGSRAIGFWSHFMFGLERNQQADDPAERKQTTWRCLKDRYTGNATGLCVPLAYDEQTGLLSEYFEGSASADADTDF